MVHDHWFVDEGFLLSDSRWKHARAELVCVRTPPDSGPETHEDSVGSKEQDLGIWNHLGVVVNWLLGACKMHLGKLLGACKLHL